MLKYNDMAMETKSPATKNNRRLCVVVILNNDSFDDCCFTANDRDLSILRFPYSSGEIEGNAVDLVRKGTYCI